MSRAPIPNREPKVKITIWFMKVLLQESWKSCGVSQLKWWMMLGPQNCKVTSRRVFSSAKRKPVSKALHTSAEQTHLFIIAV